MRILCIFANGDISNKCGEFANGDISNKCDEFICKCGEFANGDISNKCGEFQENLRWWVTFLMTHLSLIRIRYATKEA